MELNDLAPRLPSPVVELDDDRLAAAGVRVWLKRDDLIHPDVPGNKWRKLANNLSIAEREGRRRLLTFGGAYSNHLRATAAAGFHLGFQTIGVVRGEEHVPLNPSLRVAADWGMQLTYLDRAAYRHKRDEAVISRLREDFGDFYLIPEGGSNPPAVRGCAELAQEMTEQLDVDVVCCPVGSGGTLAGLAAGLPPGRAALGIAVLKGAGFLDEEVLRLQQQTYGGRAGDWRIDYGFSHGGYAKRSPELNAFIDDFESRHGIQLEWVYVAKLLSGIYAKVRRGDFAAGSKIAAVVTGGVEPRLGGVCSGLRACRECSGMAPFVQREGGFPQHLLNPAPVRRAAAVPVRIWPSAALAVAPEAGAVDPDRCYRRYRRV